MNVYLVIFIIGRFSIHKDLQHCAGVGARILERVSSALLRTVAANEICLIRQTLLARITSCPGARSAPTACNVEAAEWEQQTSTCAVCCCAVQVLN